MDDHPSFDNEIRLALYRYFVGYARPPAVNELAGLVGVRPVEVEQSLRRLHDNHVIVLAPGTPYVWMANPFSAVPTPYHAEVEDRAYFGNCIWDAMGIVAMLGGTGRVTAGCPDCGEQLTVDVTDGAIESSDHVVHYAVPAAHWWDDIGFN